MKKKILTYVLCLGMGMTLLAGCGNEDKEPGGVSKETGSVSDSSEESSADDSSDSEESSDTGAQVSDDPMDLLKGNYFTYAYDVEGIGDFANFFHFYDEIEGIGNVYYAGLCLNAIPYAGTYTIEAVEREYSCYPERGAEEKVTGTAPYTVTFYDWDGSVKDMCAFDGEILYNDMTAISGMGADESMYQKDTDIENSKHAAAYEAEAGLAYLDFVGTDDTTCTLSLYHNGKYMDLVNMMVEGTWGVTASDENGSTITLTPESETDAGATLQVAADQATAVYRSEDGTEVNLTNKAVGEAAVFHMEGKTPIPGQEDVEADMAVDMYADGTCQVLVEAFGMSLPLDQGTYELGEDYTFHFTFEKAGTADSVMGETGQITLQYVQAGTELGDVDAILTLIVE